MSDLNELVDRYLAVWNEPDPQARQQAIAGLWTEDGSYTDPLADVVGHEAIGAVIAGAREQFPGFVFTRAGAVDAHHNIARFTWELAPADGGEALVVGFDVAVVAEDGRLRGIYGFLDKVPSA
ncbi:nuclear transport factor 2 family protein [Goodfellowiella coeruleoviolacea]|uniref:SnoaL-like domain-containing protein n=1 Tax=Goodfellowiella coeruleoviolacea TaxID=334858 RepID=A0AAE3GJX0_9PSEU|nr:nuclear transport factor 2 family protein [Goodfellowiella coeruleoviolacea]MCP2168918.1 SnoaL-like domain-containing protein [Goodfellowiella coeruleoviolacea]